MCLQIEAQKAQSNALHHQNASLQAQLAELQETNQQLSHRLEAASHGTSRLNDIIQGLESRHEQVVAAKGLAEDESSRLRQLLDESLAAGEGPLSQHILRGYERRLAAAHQHLVKQVSAHRADTCSWIESTCALANYPAGVACGVAQADHC